MKEIVMIRHGESEANANGTLSGWSPINLTEKGRQQAEETRKYMKGLTFDRLFVSDVLRAQQTADIIFPDMPRTFMPVAREMNVTAMRGKTAEELTELYGKKYLKCRRDLDFSPLGIDCESKEHLSNRTQELLDMMAALPDANRVAVVAHARFIRTAAARILGLSDVRSLPCLNASVSIFRHSPNGWDIVAWSLSTRLP